MEKLELKHLAGYLPYGLKMELLGFPFTQILGKHYRTLELDCGHDFHFYLQENKVRPILRPLSDLTKEIEVNGEKFIPLVKLFDIVFGIEHEEFVISTPAVCMRISDSTQKLEFDERANCFWCEELNNDGNEWSPPHNQLELFQKLYEWHFDIHGLIEKGLAIDINTL